MKLVKNTVELDLSKYHLLCKYVRKFYNEWL